MREGGPTIRTHRIFFWVVAVSAFALAFAGSVGAQINTVNLSGTVTDPQGLAVQGAKLTAKSLATGSERTTVSDVGGRSHASVRLCRDAQAQLVRPTRIRGYGPSDCQDDSDSRAVEPVNHRGRFQPVQPLQRERCEPGLRSHGRPIVSGEQLRGSTADGGVRPAHVPNCAEG